jgi:hypothetical protein
VCSKHPFGSLKGRFASLRELRFQIQDQKKFNYVTLWVRCCFILHNLIIQIETKLGLKDTSQWARSEVDFDEEYTGGVGDYGDESWDGEDEAEAEEEDIADVNDLDSIAGKRRRDILANIAQEL